MARTRIIATLGPSSRDERTLEKMILEGVTVFRLNFAHGTLEEKVEEISLIKKVAGRLGVPVATMVDVRGPEIRTVMGRKALKIEAGDIVTVSGPDGVGEIKIEPANVLSKVGKGDYIFISGGKIQLEVLDVKPDLVRCEVVFGGIVTDKRGVNIPNVDMEVEGLTERDKKALKVAVGQGVDFVALSFIKTRENVDEAVKFLKSISENPPSVIAKIETRAAVRNIKEIIESAYGVMVARGDLGVEIPLNEVPIVQKEIIRKCNEAAKPVITATEMLESMISNPRPTRAEVSDVFNAILDGTDAVMLSEETAAGRYPVLSVRWMRKISEEAEKFLRPRLDLPIDSIPSVVSKAAVQASIDLNAKAIVCDTFTGFTARNISRHRPKAYIVAVPSSETVVRRLMLTWGVDPVLLPGEHEQEKVLRKAMEYLRARRLISKGDRVLFSAGLPFGHKKTNMFRVVEVE